MHRQQSRQAVAIRPHKGAGGQELLLRGPADGAAHVTHTLRQRADPAREHPPKLGAQVYLGMEEWTGDCHWKRTPSRRAAAEPDADVRSRTHSRGARFLLR